MGFFKYVTLSLVAVGVVVVLFAYMALMTFSYSGFSRFLPALLRERGVGEEVIGVAYSLEKAVTFVVVALATALSLRAGPRSFLLMPLMTALMAALFPLFTVVRGTLELVVFVALFAGLYMGLRPFNRSLVNIVAPEKSLGTVTGLLHVVARVSSIVSVALVGTMLALLGVGRTVWVLFFLALCALLFQIVLIRGVVGRGGAEFGGYSLRDSLRRLGAIVSNPVIVYDVVTSFFETGVAVYSVIVLWDLLGGPLPAGIATAAIEAGFLILAPIMGAVADRVNKPVRFIALSSVVIALGYLSLSLGYYAPSDVGKIALVGVAILAFSLSPSLYIPNFQKFVRGFSKGDAETLTVFSSIEALQSLTSIPAPLIAGVLISLMGYSYYLLTTALLIIIATIVFLAWYTAAAKRH